MKEQTDISVEKLIAESHQMPWEDNILEQYRDVSDDELGLAISLGVLIQSRANSRGLGLRQLSGCEGWMRFIPELMVGDLRVTNGDLSVRRLLKDVRDKVHRGEFKGQQRQAFDIISRLMRTPGRCDSSQPKFEIPPEIALISPKE